MKHTGQLAKVDRAVDSAGRVEEQSASRPEGNLRIVASGSTSVAARAR
jgi:hypothetical protein